MKEIKSILIVDDDEVYNFHTKHLLKKMGFDKPIYEAINGQDALDKIKEFEEQNIEIGLILLDINMPIMNGFEFLDEFQKLNSSSHHETIVVMISSSTHSEDYNRAKQYECISNYIEKPIGIEDLKSLIKPEE